MLPSLQHQLAGNIRATTQRSSPPRSLFLSVQPSVDGDRAGAAPAYLYAVQRRAGRRSVRAGPVGGAGPGERALAGSDQPAASTLRSRSSARGAPVDDDIGSLMLQEEQVARPVPLRQPVQFARPLLAHQPLRVQRQGPGPTEPQSVYRFPNRAFGVPPDYGARPADAEGQEPAGRVPAARRADELSVAIVAAQFAGSSIDPSSSAPRTISVLGSSARRSTSTTSPPLPAARSSAQHADHAPRPAASASRSIRTRPVHGRAPRGSLGSVPGSTTSPVPTIRVPDDACSPPPTNDRIQILDQLGVDQFLAGTLVRWSSSAPRLSPLHGVADSSSFIRAPRSVGPLHMAFLTSTTKKTRTRPGAAATCARTRGRRSGCRVAACDASPWLTPLLRPRPLSPRSGAAARLDKRHEPVPQSLLRQQRRFCVIQRALPVFSDNLAAPFERTRLHHLRTSCPADGSRQRRRHSSSTYAAGRSITAATNSVASSPAFAIPPSPRQPFTSRARVRRMTVTGTVDAPGTRCPPSHRTSSTAYAWSGIVPHTFPPPRARAAAELSRPQAERSPQQHSARSPLRILVPASALAHRRTSRRLRCQRPSREDDTLRGVRGSSLHPGAASPRMTHLSRSRNQPRFELCSNTTTSRISALRSTAPARAALEATSAADQLRRARAASGRTSFSIDLTLGVDRRGSPDCSVWRRDEAAFCSRSCARRAAADRRRIWTGDGARHVRSRSCTPPEIDQHHLAERYYDGV